MSHDPEAPPAGPPIEYLFGPFRLDVAALQLWHGDELVGLTPKAFDTLLVLIRHRQRLVRKEELMNVVWGNAFVSEDRLTQNITALRRALGDDHHQPEYITTVPRRGYRFIAPVTERAPIDNTGASATQQPGSASADRSAAPSNIASASVLATRPHGAWLWMSIAAAGAFLVAYFILNDRQTAAPALGSLRFTIAAPPGTRLASGGAVSPDSRYLVFVAEDDPSGTTRLWIRGLHDGESRALDGTEGANRPFWSPDSQSIGFFASGRVKRVGIAGGPIQTVAPTVGLTVSGRSPDRPRREP